MIKITKYFRDYFLCKLKLIKILNSNYGVTTHWR